MPSLEEKPLPVRILLNSKGVRAVHMEEDPSGVLWKRSLLYAGEYWPSIQHIITFQIMLRLIYWHPMRIYSYLRRRTWESPRLAAVLAVRLLNVQEEYKRSWSKVREFDLRQIYLLCALQSEDIYQDLMYPGILKFENLPFPDCGDLRATWGPDFMGKIFWDTREYLQKLSSYIRQQTQGPYLIEELEPEREDLTLTHEDIPPEVREYINEERKIFWYVDND